jgi:hypothetical protein
MKQWTAAGLAAYVREQGHTISNRHIRLLCQRGRIQATKLGRDWVIEDDEAQEWIRRWLNT